MSERPQWVLGFHDLQTDRPFMYKVDCSKKQLLYGGVIAVRRMGVTAQQWGISIECEGGCAGVAWEDSEPFLAELAHMAVACKVNHNIPPQFVPTGPLHIKHARAMQGGRLCLKEGLITRLITARYGSHERGWVDCRDAILKGIVNGGVKGLVINQDSMCWRGTEGEQEQGVDSGEVENRLEIMFLTASPPKPPPPRSSGSGASRRSCASHLSDTMSVHSFHSVTEASSVVSSHSTELSPLSFTYMAYVTFRDAPKGLFLSRYAYTTGTPVVVSAMGGGTECGTVVSASRISDVTSCGDVEQHIIRKANEAEVRSFIL